MKKSKHELWLGVFWISFFFLATAAYAKKTDPMSEDEQSGSMEMEQEPSDLGQNPAGTEAATEPVQDPWAAYPPAVQVAAWGDQIRVTVSPHSTMPKEKQAAIKDIKLETVDGKFLGFRPFSPEEERRAQFLIDPVKLPITEAKVMVTSTVDGLWSQIISLEIAKEKEMTQESSPEPGSGEVPSSAPSSETASMTSTVNESDAAKASAEKNVSDATPPSPEKPKKKGWPW